jgi:hypothetical protein
MEHQDGTITETRVRGVDGVDGQYVATVWMRVGEEVTVTRLDDLNGVWEATTGDGTRVGLYATKTKALEALEAAVAREWLA